MESVVSLTKRKNPQTTRVSNKTKFLKTVVEALEEKKAENIIVLDLRKIPEAVADFFLVCEANSALQIKAIADNVEKEAWENSEEKVFHKEGLTGMQWVVVDFVDIVVHIMHPETRKFYNLEEMWSDAVVEELS